MKHLPWDSELFGLRLARTDLPEEDLAASVATARDERIECLYIFVPADRLDLVRSAVVAGARPLEVRTELDWRVDAVPEMPNGVRLAEAADEPALRELAVPFSASSRFRLDPRFPPDRVAEMYMRWVRRCLDEGTIVVPEGEITGYGGVRVADGLAWYDLLYVSSAARGSGTGKALVTGGLASAGATSARTTMQLANLPVQRIFQSVGFRIASATIVLHLWLDEAG